jgi:uncharacterized phage protein gp47/JayE
LKLFEDQTVEVIRERMLASFPPNIDKRENSIAYDAVAPAASEMAELYAALDVFIRLAFPDTASGEYLRRRARDFGVNWKEATLAIRKGVFKDTTGANLDVPIGSRYTFNSLTFEAIERISLGVFKMQSESKGLVGNDGTGPLLPIEPIANLGSAEITEVLSAGVEEETDDELRERLMRQVRRQATSGNAYHYEQWALEVSGVGGVRVIPVWNGGGTVKVVILSPEKRTPSQTIVDEVYNYIESVRPVLAGTLTVIGATEVAINVTATITLADGSTIAEVTEQFNEALKVYLQSLAFKEGDALIRYSRIANLLLDIPLIIDYQNLLVNGAMANIQPADDAVGVVGVVNFT